MRHALLILAGLFLANSLQADVVFTNNTTIGAGDLSYEGSDLAVQSCTVTVQGVHSFGSVSVTATGRLTQATNLNVTGLTVNNHSICSLAGASVLSVTNAMIVSGVSTVLCNGANTTDQVGGAWSGSGVRIIASSLTVGSDSLISAAGKGYSGGQGPGAGPTKTSTGPVGSGASYGGHGSDSGSGAGVTNTYGSELMPTDLGSGGGSVGGAGGGAIRLTVSGTLLLDGAVSASGNDGDSRVCGGGSGGGGSGGSIYITAGTISGSGYLAAYGGNGGNGGCGGESDDAGGGGGGRIAVYYGTNSGFTGYANASAMGGIGLSAIAGEDGTVGFFESSGTNWHLKVYERFTQDEDTTNSFASVTLSSNACYELGGGGVLNVESNLNVTDSSTLIVQGKNEDAEISGRWSGLGGTIYAGNVNVDIGAVITACGQGYSGEKGPGAGPTKTGTGPVGSGGSYGGIGGNSGSGAGMAETYGDSNAPIDFGSGGGSSGGSGGGLIRMTVSGTLTLNGQVIADGTNGASRDCGNGGGGGGSGGSIFVSAGTLAGSGCFTADGGNGGDGGCFGEGDDGGGGGGGRIAVYYRQASGFSGAGISSANGGSGISSSVASNGTVLFSGTETYLWEDADDTLFHGTKQLRWSALAVDLNGMTVEIRASGNNASHVLATNLAAAGGMAWDTTAVSNGAYELRLLFRNASATLVKEVPRTVIVNNEAVWHTGSITNNETWSAAAVHIVEYDLVICTNATVTIQAGAIVKFASGKKVTIKNGGTLVASGSASAAIILTSLADDTAGGDTNEDGSETIPLPGDWKGIEKETGGTFTYNDYTSIRYVKSGHSGTLSSSETWYGTYLHQVTNDLTIPSGVTLTIDAGAIVKFSDKKGITINSGGRLVANGTVACPIIFTSDKDDTVGGDTNGDGAESEAMAGDWKWMYLNGGAAEFNHCEIRYGGGNNSGSWDSTGMLRTSGNAVLSVSNSVIRDSFYDGILAEGPTNRIVSVLLTGIDRAVCAQGGSAVQVLNCTLDDNRIGLLVHGGTLVADNTIVANSTAAGVQYDFGTLSSVRYCDVWNTNSGAINYSNTTDQTGSSGNISIDPKFKDRAQYDFRLNYLSPCIDAADATVAPAYDSMNSPRYTDPRSPHTGVASGGVYADIGAREFVETAPSDLDLIVTTIDGPSSVVVGDQATVSWVVMNIGSANVVGPWHDSVYLDYNGTAVLVGETPAGAGATLGPGQSTTVSTTLRVPGSVVGSHRWKVKTNNRGEVFEGSNTANNSGWSLAYVDVDLPELVVDGAEVSRSFSTAGESHWFKINITNGQALRLALAVASNAGAVELYASRGSVPTTTSCQYQQAEWNTSSVTLAFTASYPGSNVYYVLAYPRRLTSPPSSFTISARSLGLTLSAVSPATAGNQGSATFLFQGAHLGTQQVYELVDSLGASHAAGVVYVRDADNAYPTFVLDGLPSGACEARVRDGAATATLANAVTITANALDSVDSSLGLNLTAMAPAAIRPGRQIPIVISYGNACGQNRTLPMLTADVTGDGQLAFRADSLLKLDRLTLLATSLEPGLSVMPPGRSGSLTLYFTAPSHTGTEIVNIYANTFDEPDFANTAIDWEEVSAQCRPAGISDEAWAEFMAENQARYGATYNSLFDYLADVIEELAEADWDPMTFVNSQFMSLASVGAAVGPRSSDEVTSDAGAGFRVRGGPILLVMPSVSSKAAARVRKVHCVIIADEDYKIFSNGSDGNNLAGTQVDATRLKHLLMGRYNLPGSQINILRDQPGTDDDTNCTPANIAKTISDTFAAASEDDLVLILNEGHGETDHTLYNQGNITATDWANILRNAPCNTLMIYDNCFSGNMVDQIHAQLAGSPQVGLLAAAYNVPELDNSINDYKGGLLTQAVIEELYLDPSISDLSVAVQRAMPRVRQKLIDYYKNDFDPQYSAWANNSSTNVAPYYIPSETGTLDMNLNTKTNINDQVGNKQVTGKRKTRCVFNVVTSVDPNEIAGPAGSGDSHWIGPNDILPYIIYFANQTNATAPAQTVRITQTLSENLDWSTFQWGAYSISTQTYAMGSGLQNYSTRLYYQTNLYVDISASLNMTNGVIEWEFTSIDPVTGLAPEDPLAGFLPPNTNAPAGEGFISYNIRPRTDLASDDLIKAQASIVFDDNAAISTGEHTNQMDRARPESSVTALQRILPRRHAVGWSGTDAGSGVAGYDIYLSTNGLDYWRWQTNVTYTNTAVTGMVGTTYRYFSVARDNVGNIEGLPATNDAATTVRDWHGDYDGDGNVDPAVYQAASGTWGVMMSGSGYALLTIVLFGPGYEVLVLDLDGDGKSDPGIYVATSGYWFAMLSGSGYASVDGVFGGIADVPVPEDYDNDGLSDPAIYNETTGAWQVLLSGSGYAPAGVVFGESGYKPKPADYDGDGRADVMVYNEASGTWAALLSGSGYSPVVLLGYGGVGYTAVPGDYDGDAKVDPALYQEATGQWRAMLSGSGYAEAAGVLGGAGYQAFQEDYDGDGKTDPAVYNEGLGTLSVMLSNSGYGQVTVPLGGAGCRPVVVH